MKSGTLVSTMRFHHTDRRIRKQKNTHEQEKLSKWISCVCVCERIVSGPPFALTSIKLNGCESLESFSRIDTQTQTHWHTDVIIDIVYGSRVCISSSHIQKKISFYADHRSSTKPKETVRMVMLNVSFNVQVHASVAFVFSSSIIFVFRTFHLFFFFCSCSFYTDSFVAMIRYICVCVCEQ